MTINMKSIIIVIISILLSSPCLAMGEVPPEDISATSGASEPLTEYSKILSPSGTKVAFIYNGDIWISNPNGTDLKRLTSFAKNIPNDESIYNGSDGYVKRSVKSPVWSPNEYYIAFCVADEDSTRTFNSDIWVISRDGSIKTQITNTERSIEFDPQWKDDQNITYKVR